MIKSIEEIPSRADPHERTDPPPPEPEPPHKKLARLTGDKERLIREIRDHRSAWAERNLIAQHKRQSVSSLEMVAYRDHHSALSEELAGVDRQIGELNRVVRQQRADVQARSSNGAGDRQRPGKKGVVGTGGKNDGRAAEEHPDWLVYFELSARNELTEAQYQQVVLGATSLLKAAREMGVEVR